VDQNLIDVGEARRILKQLSTNGLKQDDSNALLSVLLTIFRRSIHALFSAALIDVIPI